MLTLATNSATALAYFLWREQGVFTNEKQSQSYRMEARLGKVQLGKS